VSTSVKRGALFIFVWSLSGCPQGIDSVFCNDGAICPSGLLCNEVHSLCVAPNQVRECDGLESGVACAYSGTAGLCDRGVCLPDVCGNGLRGPDEACDDGNTEPGDGCSADCQSNELCGNGVVDDAVGEDCDCGTAGDIAGGCRHPNSDEIPGAECRSDCVLHCGDGEVNLSEDCEEDPPDLVCVDLGFDRGGIGCDATCSFDLSRCGRIGWIEESPALVFAWPTAAQVFDPQHAVVAAVTLFPIPNNWSLMWHLDGTAWTFHEITDLYVRDVWGTGPDNIYAVGAGEKIYHYDGASWSLVAHEKFLDPGEPNLNLQAIHGYGDRFVTVGQNRSVVFDGSTFDVQDHPLVDLLEVWTDAAGNIVMFGESLPFRTRVILQWDGSIWESKNVAGLPPNGGRPLRSVWGNSIDNLIAVGDGGLAARYDGEEWTVMPFPEVVDLSSVDGAGPERVYALAAEGRIFYFDGVAWRETSSPSNDLRALGVGPLGTLVVASHEIYRATGSTWVSAPETYRALWSPDGISSYGLNTTSLTALEGGTDVDIADLQPGESAVQVVGTSVDDFFVGTDEGRVLRCSTASCADTSARTSANLVFGGSGAVFVADASGADHFSAGWSPLPSLNAGTFVDLWHGDGGLYAIVKDGVEHAVVRLDGASWVEEISVDFGLAKIHGAGSSVVAIGGAKILHRRDGVWHQEMIEVSVVDVYARSSDDIVAVDFLGEAIHFDGISWAPFRGTDLFNPLVLVTGRITMSGTGGLRILTRHLEW
jgi:cysteine-rich repeat protein